MKVIPKSYIESFTQLSDLTASKCGACHAPHACCNTQQCEDTAQFALETFGVTLERQDGPLPFLGAKGCTVPPHLRPICTVHVCENHLKNPEFAEQYFSLRERAGDELEAIMSPE
jgi:hypothetical protein